MSKSIIDSGNNRERYNHLQSLDITMLLDLVKWEANKNSGVCCNFYFSNGVKIPKKYLSKETE